MYAFLVKKTWKFLSSTKSFTRTFTMDVIERMQREAKHVFEHCVHSVKPENLLKRVIITSPGKIQIFEESFPIHNNVYIVGFGKAVLGMGLVLEEMLQGHVVSGILSVPFGIKNHISSRYQEQISKSKLQIYEGAANNIPDNNSLVTASEITRLVNSLPSSSLLLVLISGGGSALLPSPKPPLTLEEKQNVIKILSSKGATIEELNTIRKQLSLLKGGGLAQLAKPAKVVSLILSDIIGDPLDLIASGPTVENKDDPSLALNIINRYGIKEILPESAIKLLEFYTPQKFPSRSFDHVHNFLIGNNTIALNAAAQKAEEFHYTPLILTSQLSGIAKEVASNILQLLWHASEKNIVQVDALCKKLNIEKAKGLDLIDAVGKDLCILLGGETTVEILGKGLGGRNQELALAAALDDTFKRFPYSLLLSAGTDGIDGPTSAAGAVAFPFMCDIARQNGMNAACYLSNNDSYNFYHSFGNGKWHVKIGHTGTNVMDIVIILIQNI